MSTTNANPYAQRIANVLGQTMKATQASLPTVSFVGNSGDGTFLSNATKYLIYALIAVLVILLILTLIHYTVKPIFNFGDNPNALISIPMTDWKQDWNTTSVAKYTDTAAKETLPQSKYSIVFDTKVDNTLPSNATKNKFILLYKTTAGLAASASVAGGASSGGDGSVVATPVVCDTPASSSGGGSSGSVSGTATQQISVKPITDFTFLQNDIVPTGGDPSFFVIYDALSSNLQALVVVNDTINNQMNYKSASVEIMPKKAYRVGIVVSDSLLELYLDGKFATSIAYPGKAVTGGSNDVIFSTPGTYSENVVVKNLFMLNRVATSGEIRQLGGPALA